MFPVIYGLCHFIHISLLLFFRRCPVRNLFVNMLVSIYLYNYILMLKIKPIMVACFGISTPVVFFLVLNIMFTAVFTVEMVMKVTAWGDRR